MSWSLSFLENEILVCNSNYSELQTKSCCEFILFCFQLKQNKLLNSNYKTVLRAIESKTDSVYYEPLLKICLDKRTAFIKKENVGIESAYIDSILENYPDFYFWNNLLLSFIQKVISRGMDRLTMYEFTHVIFYATNFGHNTFLDQVPNNIKNAVKNIILDCIHVCRTTENWDLLREFYITLLIFEPKYVTIITNAVYIENCIMKSEHGWFLSNGRDLRYYENNYESLSFKQKYCLYHTTLISELLDVYLRDVKASLYA